jgi:GNS1/SUR4 family
MRGLLPIPAEAYEALYTDCCSWLVTLFWRPATAKEMHVMKPWAFKTLEHAVINHLFEQIVNPGWLVAIACCYVPLAVFGSRFMKRRKPYRLHGLWALWNMTMCLFSACGAYYVWVDLLLPK